MAYEGRFNPFSKTSTNIIGYSSNMCAMFSEKQGKNKNSKFKLLWRFRVLINFLKLIHEKNALHDTASQKR